MATRLSLYLFFRRQKKEAQGAGSKDINQPSWTMLALAWAAIVAPRFGSAAAARVSACNSTSVAMTVEFDGVPSTDLYYLALSASNASKPFALQTVAPPAREGDTVRLTVEDLVPDRSYWLRVRSHPESEATIAWGPGWRDYGPAVECRTQAVQPQAPGRVRRRKGTDLDSSSVVVAWDPPAATNAAGEGFRVWWQAAGGDAAPSFVAVPPGAQSANITGLTPRTALRFHVEALPSGRRSDGVTLRTGAADDRRWDRVYRISEYSFDVDFLSNHDSATVDAMPLYLMTCDPSGDCQPLNTSSYSKDWDRCEAGMQDICPGQRGTGLSCLDCAKAHNESVTGSCGPWQAKDNFVGYAVHWYCGTGWPESILTSSPVTEYCVESTPVPEPLRKPGWADSEGYATYASCNSDETDPFGNKPRDPICMCWVWDDRTLSMQPKSEIDAHCGGATIPFVGEIQCNCSSNPERRWSNDGTPADTYVGRAKLYLPYGYYREPRETYPDKEETGSNLSTPKRGRCNETQALGDEGCTWRRDAKARILRWDDVMAAGWNTTWDPDRPGHTKHTKDNIAAFKRAVDGLSEHMTPRCCGC